MKRVWASLALALCVTSAHAQENAAPRGPADIMKRAAEARAKQKPGPLQQGAAQPAAAQTTPPEGLPPGHPDVAPAPQEERVPPGPSAAESGDSDVPVGNDPHSGMEGAPPLARRPMTSGEPNAQVPAGTIRVHVLDANEQPVNNAEVQVGTMSQAGRTSLPGRTNAEGYALFDKLATGDKQAYRVNVLHQGAKYSSMPFRLPTEQGFDVVIRQLETTKDTRDVVLYVGATSVELKDERLKVVQQARLVNIGAKTYVFPEEGTLVKLPKDVLAFQAEEIMTDQHLREVKGEGMRITGSIPPGEVTLTWGFDVPQTETEADLSFDMPWVTFAYRVLADAAPGMQLEVDGMPPAELHEDAGRRFFVTEVVKRVGEQPLKTVHIHLKGIPGPGPLRFIAVGLALFVLALGVLVARKSLVHTGGKGVALHDLQLEKERLLARAKDLDAEHSRGEIGPEFHKNALHDLEEQLAGVLYEQAQLSRKAS